MNATRWKLRQQLCRQTIINENPSVKSIISSSFRRNGSPSLLCCFIIIASTTTVKIQKEEVKLQIKTINVKHISKSKQRCKFPRQLNRRQTDGRSRIPSREKKDPNCEKTQSNFKLLCPFCAVLVNMKTSSPNRKTEWKFQEKKHRKPNDKCLSQLQSWSQVKTENINDWTEAQWERGEKISVLKELKKIKS